MTKMIHKLRARPDHHKKAIAFTVSFVLTGIVFAIWFTSQNFFSDTTVIAAATEKGPLQVFSENIASGYDALKSNFK